jgi:hypothetical protein
MSAEYRSSSATATSNRQSREQNKTLSTSSNKIIEPRHLEETHLLNIANGGSGQSNYSSNLQQRSSSSAVRKSEAHTHIAESSLIQEKATALNSSSLSTVKRSSSATRAERSEITSARYESQLASERYDY